MTHSIFPHVIVLRLIDGPSVVICGQRESPQPIRVTQSQHMDSFCNLWPNKGDKEIVCMFLMEDIKTNLFFCPALRLRSQRPYMQKSIQCMWGCESLLYETIFITNALLGKRCNSLVRHRHQQQTLQYMFCITCVLNYCTQVYYVFFFMAISFL